MRTRLFIVLLILTSAICSARPAYTVNLDSALVVLDREISIRQNYYNTKEAHIASVRSRLSDTDNSVDNFKVLDMLYDEYRQYQSDSAFYYSKRLEDIAEISGDSVMAAIARLKHFDYFLSVWMQDEALAEYYNIDYSLLPDKDRLLFYKNCITLFYRFGLPEYNVGEAKKREYELMCEAYTDSIIAYAKPGTFEYEFYSQNKSERGKDAEAMIVKRLGLLQDNEFIDHERAELYASLSGLAERVGDLELQAYCNAVSAIYDIRSSTHETASVFALANLMNDLKDMDRAVRYIRVAFDDALFFNSRVKQSQVGLILPLLETIRYENITYQRHIMAVLLIFISLSLFLTGILLAKLLRRNKRLENMRVSLNDAQDKLVEANTTLSSLNSKLKETIALKDSYIMQSLYINTSFLKQVECRCREAINNMKTKGLEAMRFLPYQMGIKEERQRIMQSFDHTFLQVFPNFIDDFNSLLNDGESVAAGDDGGLSTELRIFALMRLGVTDTGAVSDFLNISANSIYVYKARIKAKSNLSKSEFDARVMAIAKP